MKLCEIYHVKHKGSYLWKWRPLGEQAATKDADKVYSLFYECVSAARKSGYQPNRKCL
jgi:hypothetical protein